MKLLLSILLMFCPTSVSYPVSTILSVTTNYAYIYEAADFSSPKIDLKLEQGTSVELLQENEINGFYNIKYGALEGYMLCECLGKVENEQDVMLVYNAKTSVKTVLHAQGADGNVDKSSGILSLDENTEVYLYEGFNGKLEYTKVKLSHNGKMYFGYIKTADISPYGVNNVLIIAITAIIACTSVILILLGISKKKSRFAPILDKIGKKGQKS